MRKLSLAIVTGILLLTACKSSRKPDDADVRKAINPRQSLHLMGQHLVNQGCRRIVFLARPGSAPTVDARIMGYRDALLQNGQIPDSKWVQFISPTDKDAVSTLLREIHPEGIICANDFTSMGLMRTLTTLSVHIPDDVLVAGFDGVKHAELLTVPLTTIHQPCSAIGAEAIAAMLERVAHPDLPASDIQLDFRMMERESTRTRHAESANQAATDNDQCRTNAV